MLDVELNKAKAQIYSHLPPLYPKSEKTIFGGIVHGIAYAIQLVRSSIESIRDQIFYSTANGSTVVGRRATFTMPGVSFRLIDDEWPVEDMTMEYNAEHRKIRLNNKPWVFIDKVPNEYDLSNSDKHSFIVFIEPSKLPKIDTSEIVVVERKTTPDYLGELSKNRGVVRRKNEPDELLRERCINIGNQTSVPAIKQQLKWLLGSDDFDFVEFREDWASWSIPGISFIQYSSKPEEKPTQYMPELYFGSYNCEKSKNTFRYKIYLPFGVGGGVTDQEIHDLCKDISASGVVAEIERSVG